MPLLVGTDEAGYGPNLGPLVVTATAWEIPEEVDPGGLYEVLEEHVCRQPLHREDLRLAIADSKLLYQSGCGLRLLERGVTAALHACGTSAHSWRDAWGRVASLDTRALDAVPWHEGYDHHLPVECTGGEITQAIDALTRGLACTGLRLLAVRSVAVFPADFNDMLDRHGNKAQVLSQCTLQLVQQMVEHLPAGPVLVSCDKHGGRNQYGPLLQTLFPEYLVEVRRESRDESIYQWGPRDRRIEFRFVAKGERFLTTALASMVSKYLRELAMRAFNAFWLRQLPGLRPTAGYPVDALRFRAAIAAHQQSLGISDRVLWRAR